MTRGRAPGMGAASVMYGPYDGRGGECRALWLDWVVRLSLGIDRSCVAQPGATPRVGWASVVPRLDVGPLPDAPAAGGCDRRGEVRPSGESLEPLTADAQALGDLSLADKVAHVLTIALETTGVLTTSPELPMVSLMTNFSVWDAIAIASEPTAADWAEAALCAQVGDGDLWFPEKHKGKNTAEAAKRVCMSCTVRAECLDAHLDEQHGVWGGMTERERRVLRQRRRGSVAA